MTVDLVSVASIYVQLIDAIDTDTPPSFQHSFPRKTSLDGGLLEFLSKYTDCKFSVFIMDFSQRDVEENQLILKSNSESVPFRSFVLNFEDRAEIYLNSNMTSSEVTDGASNTWLRFLVVKEALHVLLRQELVRNAIRHPDIELSPEVVLQHIEELISVPLTKVDFENLSHSNMLKIEHAAALLSCLLLYPLNRVLGDRKRLMLGTLDNLDKEETNKEIGDISKLHLIPENLVLWLLKWDRLDEFEGLVAQEMMGFGR